MNINRHNYEAFFLDHIEGRLSPEQELELMEFLSLNPDLAAELTDYESVYLDKEKIIFEGKPGIKKNENELTSVEQLIALMEGDLTSREATELKKKIQSDSYLHAQSELLLKTKLVPDASIRFPDKNKLKRRGKVIYLWHYAAAAAAIIIIGLIFNLREIGDKKTNQNIAQKHIIQKNSPGTPSITSATNNRTTEKHDVLAENKKQALKSPSQKKQVQKEKAEKISEPVALISPVKSEIVLPVREETLPVSNASLQKETQPELASENTFDYRDVFTADEWNELQQIRKDSGSLPKRLAKEGISRLGELTRVRVKLPDPEKQQNVFAFSVGNFEVRHVSSK